MCPGPKRRAEASERQSCCCHRRRISILYSEIHDNACGVVKGARSEVEIRLKNGDAFTHFVEYPKGEPENPLGQEELEQKFRESAALSLDDEEIDKIVEMIRELEKIDEIPELTKLLSAS